MKTIGPLRLAGLAGRMMLAAPLIVTRALTVTPSAAVLATALTTFSPLFSALPGRGERRDPYSLRNTCHRPTHAR
jgi:hypothetical protein